MSANTDSHKSTTTSAPSDTTFKPSDPFSRLPPELRVMVVSAIGQNTSAERQSLLNFALASQTCASAAEYELSKRKVLNESNAKVWFRQLANEEFRIDSVCASEDLTPRSAFQQSLNHIRHIVIDCDLREYSEAMLAAEKTLLTLQQEEKEKLFARLQGVTTIADIPEKTGFMQPWDYEDWPRLFPQLFVSHQLTASIKTRDWGKVSYRVCPYRVNQGLSKYPLVYKISAQTISQWIEADGFSRSQSRKDDSECPGTSYEEIFYRLQHSTPRVREHLRGIVRDKDLLFRDLAHRVAGCQVFINQGNALFKTFDSELGQFSRWLHTQRSAFRDDDRFPDGASAEDIKLFWQYLTETGMIGADGELMLDTADEDTEIEADA